MRSRHELMTMAPFFTGRPPAPLANRAYWDQLHAMDSKDGLRPSVAPPTTSLRPRGASLRRATPRLLI